jgi:hypothetical protein
MLTVPRIISWHASRIFSSPSLDLLCCGCSPPLSILSLDILTSIQSLLPSSLFSLSAPCSSRYLINQTPVLQSSFMPLWLLSSSHCLPLMPLHSSLLSQPPSLPGLCLSLSINGVIRLHCYSSPPLVSDLLLISCDVGRCL